MRSPQAFEPIATKKNTETLAQCPANAPQKSRAERITALDELMSDFDRKAEWVSVQLHHSLNSDRWVNCWRVYKVPQPERAEFERIIVHLRSRDPVLRRAIEGIKWDEGVTISLRQGAFNRG